MKFARAFLEFLFIIAFLMILILRKSQNGPAFPVYERFHLFLPSDRKGYAFNGDVILKQQKSKKVIEVSLLGIKEDDDKRMEFIRFKARELMFTNDTTRYIKIRLPDTLTYGQFVDLLRMVNEDKHKRYMLFEDAFYIFFISSSNNHKEIKPITL